MKVIITGVTGMVGEGVLQECLLRNEVSEILIVNRRPSGFTHAKLREIVHADFFDLTLIEKQLIGYDACYFCLGISSVGIDADTYYHMTYNLTTNFAVTLSRLNPQMTFCYVSGAGTDSTEQGNTRWARVKGKTENDLMKLPFRQVFNFRPGALIPTKGAKNVNKLYKWLSWMIPIIKLTYPNGICTLKQLGQAMIYVTKHGYRTRIIEVKDIHEMTKSAKSGA